MIHLILDRGVSGSFGSYFTTDNGQYSWDGGYPVAGIEFGKFESNGPVVGYDNDVSLVVGITFGNLGAFQGAGTSASFDLGFASLDLTFNGDRQLSRIRIGRGTPWGETLLCKYDQHTNERILMISSKCKICDAKTVSALSKLSATRFRPHVCKNCGARSYIHPQYYVFFIILISIIFWSVFGVLFLLKLPVVLAGLSLPFAIYYAFQIVYPEKRNRIYLSPSISKNQESST